MSKWEKDMKILVSYVNVHQKVISAEEEFNNQVERMTHFVDSKSLCPAIPVIIRWGHDDEESHAWA